MLRLNLLWVVNRTLTDIQPVIYEGVNSCFTLLNWAQSSLPYFKYLFRSISVSSVAFALIQLVAIFHRINLIVYFNWLLEFYMFVYHISASFESNCKIQWILPFFFIARLIKHTILLSICPLRFRTPVYFAVNLSHFKTLFNKHLISLNTNSFRRGFFHLVLAVSLFHPLTI